MKTLISLFQMLNCILGMVDKTKRALGILQQRQQQQQKPPQPPKTFPGDGYVEDRLRSARPGQQLQNPNSMSDLLAATIRSTEERVIEVRRRAEEAVQEVRIEVEVFGLTVLELYYSV